jgi:CDP-diacylglycerol--glycerol-3-phosphate 3-phosphatidyltransferase
MTDWLDGYLARRWHQTSAVGTLLDPIADKILVLGILAVFAFQRVVPAWVVILMAGREGAVTATRLWAAKRRLVLGSAREGKLKTVIQMLSLFLLLLALAGGAALPATWEPALWALHLMGLGLLCMALALTLSSGFAFFRTNWQALRAARRGA